MKAVTIRGIEAEIAEKLKKTATKQKKSVNQYILDLIKTNLGLNKEKKFSRIYDDLDDLFGGWSNDEFTKIDNFITSQRQIDEEIWK